MTVFVVGLVALVVPVAFPVFVWTLNRSARARIAAEAVLIDDRELVR